MALTGRFEADFESFYQAVDKADAKLTDFQSGAGRVESALNRMVDNFSGRKIIQEATLSAEAIERIGGAGKLTEAELQAAAAKASEAVQKFQALGIAAPQSIQNIAKELKPAREETSLLGEAFVEVGKYAAGAFAIDKIIEFTLNIGKSEQALSRLSDQTQIGTNDLQDLTNATEEYGIENEQLARGLFNVSKGISGGDESVSRGLAEIGISLDSLKGKNGKELFLDIEDGLAKLTGTARDAAAADIFGSKLGGQLAAFSTHAREATDAAEKFNQKLSPEEIKQLKDYADEVEHLEKNLGTLKDKVLGGIAGAINSVSEANKNGLSYWRQIGDAAQDYLHQLLGLGPGVKLITDQVIASEQAAKAQKDLAGAAAEVPPELSKEGQALQFLDTLRQNSAKALEPYQVRALEQLRQMGQLNAQNAAAIGVSADQFKQYTTNVDQATAATKLLTDATLANTAQVQKAAQALADQNTKNTGTQTEQELAAIDKQEKAEIESLNRRADAEKAALAATHNDSQANLDKIDAATAAATKSITGSFDKMKQDVGVDFDEIRTHSQGFLDDQAQRALRTLLQAEGAGVGRAELEKLRDKYYDARDAATAAGQSGVAGQKAAQKATEDNVSALDKELARLKEIDKQNAIGFSREYDLSTNAGRQAFLRDNPGASIGVGPDWFKQQGHTLAEAIADGLVTFANSGQLFDSFRLGGRLNAQTNGPGVNDPFAASSGAGSSGSSPTGSGATSSGGGRAPLTPSPTNQPSAGTTASAGLGFTKPGSKPPGTVNINAPIYVSGVFDPASAHALSEAVGAGIMNNVSNARVLR